MPSYRVVLEVNGVRPGTAPPEVLPRAVDLLAATHRVEDQRLDLVGRQPRITLRFWVKPTNDMQEDREAVARARSLVDELSVAAELGRWQVRRRDPHARGGWPIVGGGPHAPGESGDRP